MLLLTKLLPSVIVITNWFVLTSCSHHDENGELVFASVVSY